MTPNIRNLLTVCSVIVACHASVAQAGFFDDLFSVLNPQPKPVPKAEPAKPVVKNQVIIINNNLPAQPTPQSPQANQNSTATPPNNPQPVAQAQPDASAAPTQQELNEMLWLASLQGNDGRVRGLVEQGADPKSGTKFGETPLHVAASRGHLKPIIYLANHGGSINARTNNGWTPLHHAARFGHYDAVRYLLHMGAIPHIRTNDKGRKSPMEMAVDNGYIEIAQLFGYRPK